MLVLALCSEAHSWRLQKVGVRPNQLEDVVLHTELNTAEEKRLQDTSVPPSIDGDEENRGARRSRAHQAKE